MKEPPPFRDVLRRGWRDFRRLMIFIKHRLRGIPPVPLQPSHAGIVETHVLPSKCQSGGDRYRPTFIPARRQAST